MNFSIVISIGLGKYTYIVTWGHFWFITIPFCKNYLIFFSLLCIRFNDNPFHKDLENHNIDLDLQLTRKEWSAIRRTVRKKPPRRFSRAFIDEEFDKLNNYRNEVRDIQKQTHMGSKPKRRNFEFEGKIVVLMCKSTKRIFRCIKLISLFYFFNLCSTRTISSWYDGDRISPQSSFTSSRNCTLSRLWNWSILDSIWEGVSWIWMVRWFRSCQPRLTRGDISIKRRFTKSEWLCIEEYSPWLLTLRNWLWTIDW